MAAPASDGVCMPKGAWESIQRAAHAEAKREERAQGAAPAEAAAPDQTDGLARLVLRETPGKYRNASFAFMIHNYRHSPLGDQIFSEYPTDGGFSLAVASRDGGGVLQNLPFVVAERETTLMDPSIETRVPTQRGKSSWFEWIKETCKGKVSLNFDPSMKVHHVVITFLCPQISKEDAPYVPVFVTNDASISSARPMIVVSCAANAEQIGSSVSVIKENKYHLALQDDPWNPGKQHDWNVKVVDTEEAQKMGDGFAQFLTKVSGHTHLILSAQSANTPSGGAEASRARDLGDEACDSDDDGFLDGLVAMGGGGRSDTNYGVGAAGQQHQGSIYSTRVSDAVFAKKALLVEFRVVPLDVNGLVSVKDVKERCDTAMRECSRRLRAVAANLAPKEESWKYRSSLI